MSIKQIWPDTVTAQEVFDHVIQHLREQNGNRAVTRNITRTGVVCVYRTPDGANACAAGALLTNDEARVIDGSAAPWARIPRAHVPARLHRHDALIRVLQSLHDSDAFARDRSDTGQMISRKAVADIANCHKLSYDPPAGVAW